MKKEPKNENGNFAPRARDYKNPKRLTKFQKELVEATREAMKALKDYEAKHGKKAYL